MKYLYRALRKEEIDAGNILIPKSQGPFRSDPIFGTMDMNFPIEFESVTNAIRHHQWQSGIPTSGVSTTPHFERAKFYAKRNGVIVKIDCQSLTKFGIIEYDVDGYLKPGEISVPEDDEIILMKEDGGSFPKEIIVGVNILWTQTKNKQ